MKLGNLLLAKCFVSLFFGILFAAAAPVVAPIFGMDLQKAGVMAAQAMGALFIGTGIICWFLRGAAPSALGRDVLLAIFVQDTIGFVVMLLGQLAGYMNALGWLTVLLWLFFAAGTGYFRFFGGAAAASRTSAPHGA